MNEVGQPLIVISDCSVLTPKPYSGAIKHFKARRSAQRLLSMTLPGIPMPPSNTGRGLGPHHRERKTSAWPSSQQTPTQEVADAGGLGGIHGEKEGRVMIRVIYSFLYLSTIPSKNYILPFWSLKVLRQNFPANFS